MSKYGIRGRDYMEVKDLTGKRYGNLVVTGRAPSRGGHTYWNCRCDCGNECQAESFHLKSGHTKSCGCLRKKRAQRKGKDLTGKRYGRLTVLAPVREADGSVKFWKCRCDCGNEVICLKDNLLGKYTRSCGCLRNETRKSNMKKAIHFVEGTCVERIAAADRDYSNNTSGCRGVYLRSNGSWRASIGFQGKVHNLGTFKDYDAAVLARKKAEAELYGAFLEKYKEKMEISEKTEEKE